ncbi:endo-alpha-N-acetylgalactosaminidase family protein [Streptomyces xanthii]|uniref:endo-alpha-N-acetylgalactosaminidase family protein n=1 Tax=Streptomyces xanthii TaxID=2768069 RepID=UPI001CB79064|nr:endo-alpha-N-acetylgalactosaminidase family protein [Streptomyces xanthii]
MPPTGQSPQKQGPSRRAVVAAGAVGGAGLALGLGGVARAATLEATAAAAATDTEAVIRSASLTVRVGTAFPRIASYTARATDRTLYAQEDAVTQLLVNNTPYTPRVTSRTESDRIAYTLTLDEGPRIDAEIAVEDWTVTFRVTAIHDTDALRVRTLQIPGLQLVSVRSTQDSATLATARVEIDKAKSGDATVRVTTDSRPDETAAGIAYAVAHTSELGAAVENNASYDYPSRTPGANWENGRFWRQVVQRDGYVKAGISNGQWTYRADTAADDDTEPLPWAKVIVTGDRNGDGVVDWQDAAIAFRDIAHTPLGADRQYQRVVAHITYNIGSVAGNPFLVTLDHVKRIHLATDGLRQFTLLKGYQSEGHDAAHPDYGGHYNERAGGLDDLNTLVRTGKKWDSDFAVHINFTESYPEARAFSEQLVDKTNKQWAWMDQSYRINNRWDLVSGGTEKRLKQLRDEVDDGLNTLYVDVFRDSGWIGDRFQRILRDQGWQVTTEWGHGLERSALWAHWANDVTYGADSSRGVNSRLIRFMRHHQKDVFADKFPLLGTARLGDFEAWQNKTDWTAFYRLIWSHTLPVKYLQARAIKTWADDEITFFGAGDTKVTATADGTRTVTTDGRTVLTGDTYLLPWDPRRALDPAKLYHYNPEGGSTTWRLPRAWAASRTRVALYRLTDQGRVFVAHVPVTGDGTVTLKADPDQPYVLYKDRADLDRDPLWGEGTPVRDPGFNSGSLHGWTVTGACAVERSATGQYEAWAGTDGAAASLAQTLRGLRPGQSYVASVQALVGDTAGERRTATLEITTAEGSREVVMESSTAVNKQSCDLKLNTRFQRMFVHFTVPEQGGDVTLALKVADGPARVAFDNVRVARATLPATQPGTLVHQDFEDVPDGIFPFIASTSRAHLAEKHAPYTQAGWNGTKTDDVLTGNWSLKARLTGTGLVYRTIPATVPFTPGKRYKVAFLYQSETTATWTTAVDEPAARTLRSDALARTTEGTAEFAYEFTAPDQGDAWVGLTSNASDGGAVVIDRFTVTELD